MKNKGLYALAVALPFLLFFGIGLLLPPKFENHARGDIQAPAELVFELLTTTDGLGEWVMWPTESVSGLTGVAGPGPTSGPGAQWRWIKDGEPWGSITVAEVDPLTRVLYDIDYGGQRIERELVLDAAGTTTTIDWSERHWIPKPTHRWLGLIMDDEIVEEIKASLRSIEAAASARWQSRSKVQP